MTSKILSTLKEGTSQRDRRIPFLSPGYAKPDDRDILDLIEFMHDISSQFNYYDFSNRIEGDWSSLLTSDPYTLIVLIAKLDIREYTKKYERLKRILKRSTNEKEIIFYFNDILHMAGEAASFLVQLLEKVIDTEINSGIAKDCSVILSNCKEEVNKLKYCNLHAIKVFGSKFKINTELFTHFPTLQPVYSKKDIFGESPDITEQIFQGITFVDDISYGLKSKLSHLITIAEHYIRNNDITGQLYNPHIGLLIAFLHLYTHLQERLNGFTARHLDYYYHDILGIKPRPAYPDSVYVLFGSNTSFHPIRLPAGTELMAKVKGREKPAIYKLQGDLTVDRAQIAELKTVFIGENHLFSDEDGNSDLKSVQVYAGNYPVSVPSSFSENNALVKPWPVLGEDQNELAQNERTMEDTDIGIIIGSSLLYLPGGERSVQLTFTFEQESFGNFKDFIAHFAARSGRSEQSVLIEMLSDSFTIDYTTQEGWQSVKHVDTHISEGQCIAVNFTLSPQDKGLSILESAIPGQHQTKALPLIRLLINNETSHNPFGIFRSLMLDQLNLKVTVKNFKDIKLQNNIGLVSSENPFQIFGPQPEVGSYLDIKNSNIFNRFTKDFAIRIDWLNLPGEPGGFKTYYEGYDTKTDNNSFRVKISALSAGVFLPQLEMQQSFQLFNTGRDEEESEKLMETTVIRGIDFKKVFFQNEMALTQEKKTEILFKEGAVKITLSSPPEGFGHKLFPQIFSKVLIHNTKRFNKSLPVPGQPFIPVARSIAIDYTLEHTEFFKAKAAESDAADDVHLIHQYPFGLDQVYPGENQNGLSFMPVFNHPGNLYIGLKDLRPGTELSLLFKLKERNTDYPVYGSNPVKWSYLFQRDWESIKIEDIVQDTTNNFINTGIVRLKVPFLINKGNNTMLNPDLYWLRASVDFKTDIRSGVVAIYPYAAQATRVLDYESSDKEPLHIPPGCIKGLVKKVPGIQDIQQPFSSFGGRQAEDDDLYRVRVSERLRHKQRPVTMLDIEQFVLNEFPDILMVKCLGVGKEEHASLAGTDLKIILIPKERAEEQIIREQPRANLATLYQVRKALLSVLSPFIKIEVCNPVYEKVKIVCKVRFKNVTGSEDGFHLKRLNEDIKRYICSWLNNSAASLKIGTTIYLSDMYNYIKSLEYVDTLTGFSMVHFFKITDIQTGESKASITDSAVDKVKYVRGSVPEAVLIPDDNHLITVLKDFKYEEPSETGIGYLPVGSKLLVPYERNEDITIEQGSSSNVTEDSFRFIINPH